MRAFLSALFLLSLVFLSEVSMAQRNTAKTWEASFKEVDSLAVSGQPKEAYALVNKLADRARAEGNSVMLIKSVIHRMLFQSKLEEDYLAKIVDSLRKDISTAKQPEKSVLQSLLAETYWKFFQDNRYRISQRTNLGADPGYNIRTWSLKKIIDEAIKQFLASVSNAEQLQREDLGILKNLLAGDSSSRNLRPSLYDLLAHRAIDVVMNPASQLGAFAGDEFIMSDPNWFSDHRVFSSMSLPLLDSSSFNMAAVKIFQDLLRYHAKGNNLAAMVDADLKRLKFIYQKSTAEERTSYYLNALQALGEQAKGTEIFPDILYEQAWVYTSMQNNRGIWKHDFRKAVEIGERIIKENPKSLAAHRAENILGPLRKKSITMEISSFSLPGKPILIELSHKNSDTAVIKVYKTFMGENYLYFNNEPDFESFMRSHKKVLDWTVKLPEYSDYEVHTLIDKIEPLPAGDYILIAASGTHKSQAGYTVSSLAFKVTALGVTNRPFEGVQQFVVLDRLSGQAIESAKVQRMFSEYSHSKKVEGYGSVFLTNKEGMASIANYPNDRQVLVSHKGDSLMVSSRAWYGNDSGRNQPRLILFTDRPIYRPGQILYFKGLLIQNENTGKSIVPGQSVSIHFEDINRKDIGKLSFVTNDYGTIQGSFTIPTGKLNGQMQLVSSYGSIRVQVEEYKRPGFEVIFDKPNQKYLLNDSIKVRGRAISYSGYSLGGANVKYTVYRIQYPNTRMSVFTLEQQIATGASKTDPTGSFIVHFLASLKPGWKGNLTYVVKAELTDLSGETVSSSRVINAGRNDIVLESNLPSELFLDDRTDSLPFTLTNLNGEPVSGKLKADWTLLQDPGRLMNVSRFSEKPDKYALSKEEFLKVFPFEAYQGDDDPANWPVSRLVLQQEVNALSGLGTVNVSSENLPPGYYRLALSAVNNSGDTISAKKIIRVYHDQPLRIQSMKEWLRVKESTIQPGEAAEFRVAGALPVSRVFYEVYYRERIAEKVWINTSLQQQIIRIIPEKGWEDAFAVQFTMVQNGVVYNILHTVNINDPARELDIKFLSFRDKLQPGEKESWRLSISSKTGEKQMAELAATLYDASLDDLKSMSWGTSIGQTYRYEIFRWGITQDYLRTSFELGFYRTPSEIRQLAGRNYEYLYKYTPNDFGNYQLGYNNYMRKLVASLPKLPSLSAQKRLSELQKGKAFYGIVSDRYGAVLQGVHVKAGIKGAITDAHGIYVINAKPGDLIQFSLIGFEFTNMKAGRKLRIDVNLTGYANPLSEVITTAYGVSNATTSVTLQRKSVMAGNVAGVDLVEEHSIKDFASVEAYNEKTNTYIINGRPVAGPERITPRTNFNETAFFYPQLRTDDKGQIIIDFTIPQSLTRYKMIGFAHTKDLKTATISRTLITQKQLAISANAPRFFREGDTILFAARLNNLSGKKLKGEASVEFRNALNGNIIQTFSQNTKFVRGFDISNAGNEALTWELVIPAGISAISYKMLAESGQFSDGEEMIIPVLPNSMLVTESIPLNVRGNTEKSFTLEKLTQSAQSGTLRNHKLTLEFTSNPLWYAIQALPYMMENQSECTEQIFSRYYANSFARGIINSSPEIKIVFQSWQKVDNGKVLLSNLERNQELKSILLEETPWVRAAEDETERKRRLSVLFDLNRMAYELRSNLDKLAQMQHSNGSFAWFPGMSDDRYITQHIVLGMGQLKKLKLIDAGDLPQFNSILDRALRFLDGKIKEDHSTEIKRKNIGYLPLHYLYARSYFDRTKDEELNKITSEYLKKIAESWRTMEPYQQGQAALVLHRFGQSLEAQKVIVMLKGNAQHNDVMGMYWISNRTGWWWYQNPIDTQSLLIEAFGEVASDLTSVEEMKIWLLKIKQTTDWKSTKATAAACYALLMQGTYQLTVSTEPDIALAGKTLSASGFPAESVEAGTGYRTTSINGPQIKPEMGNIVIKNSNKNIAWGSLYWQYFEQLDKIKRAETGVRIKKELFLLETSNTGTVLHPLNNSLALKPGDLLKVRIEIYTDRDMEYLHLKDMRSSGFAPVNVLSGYKYQHGLGYYESTKDASTNFYISYLRKGVYVFEYPLRVSHSGNFSNGITSLQSMYAPEFTTHSEGVRVSVR
ncbi:MG2 domain-containing protein [Daejeonella sp.]|uniref:alpha-2-macroglobulin family protein n=1 Tax=Daejeonella sp. TaxID=2805397 RepID=UPI00398316CB